MSISNMNVEELIRHVSQKLYPTLPYRSIKKNYDIERNVNTKICAECGGECCKRCGCHFSPDDFEEISFDCLKREIEKGYISIEYVDGEVIYQNYDVYILRIRNQGAPIVDFGPRSSPCILLTEKGCKLDYEQRPSGGKLLIPSNEIVGLAKKRRNCHSEYSIQDCCYEWRPHQKILHDLREYFKFKEIQCSL